VSDIQEERATIMIIDFHTHAFHDALAPKAIAALTAGIDIKTKHDGTVSSLLTSMDKAGIDKAVICSIATKPSQYIPILEWSRSIMTDRIIPFPSIHPADGQPHEKLRTIAGSGFKGIKLHPYYQEFSIDEDRMFPIYETCSLLGLIIVCHTGFDIAFPRNRIADPEKIALIARKFPELKFVATHLGAWSDWDEVITHLVGKNIYMECSYSLETIDPEKALTIFKNHPSDYLLFGTDSPWTDQSDALRLIRKLGLDPGRLEKVLYANAAGLLGLQTQN
jgi:predicted TIM-barrel fold metal-dependent hydrolase